MPTDEELTHAVAGGDGEALRELIRRYEKRLFQFLFRQSGGREVEDLFQETWLRVVRAAPRFDVRRRFSTWLFQIAVNLCRDERRRSRPEPVDPGEIDARGGEEVSGLGRAEIAIDARRLLEMLPEAQRAVVLLRVVHDLGEEEVAEILGCPRGTVKSRLHHALSRLGELVRGPS